MTAVSTAGTRSCATIALAGFGNTLREKDKLTCNKTYNELYKADPEKFMKTFKADVSVSEFYANILYPIKQDLGETSEYPFELLMKEIDKGGMKSKYITITLNSHQNMEYWPDELTRHGFKKVAETNNNIGQVCHVWVRNLNDTGWKPEEVNNNA